MRQKMTLIPAVVDLRLQVNTEDRGYEMEVGVNPGQLHFKGSLGWDC